MDSILHHFPLTVEVGKPFSFLCVCEHRVVSNSKSSVKATLRFASLEYRTKFGHWTFEMTFANAFGTEFILVNAARLQSSEFSLQTSALCRTPLAVICVLDGLMTLVLRTMYVLLQSPIIS